jgi:phosphohistidine phosphatase SixA
MKKDHRKLRRRPLFAPLLAPVLGGVIVVMMLGVLWTAQSQTTVILVRHADIRETAQGTAVLSDSGVYRAKALAGWLKSSDLSRIYISDYGPTRETAAPTADVTGVALIEFPADDVRGLVKTVSGLRGETVLIVGQADTLPRIIEVLAGQNVVVADNDFSGLYIVTDSILTRARLLKMRYGG